MIEIYVFSDHACHQLRNTSRGINLYGGVEKIDPNVSVPDSWASNSNRNVQMSQSKFGLFNVPNSFLRIILIKLNRCKIIISTSSSRCGWFGKKPHSAIHFVELYNESTYYVFENY